jgi:hypothetical protein
MGPAQEPVKDLPLSVQPQPKAHYQPPEKDRLVQGQIHLASMDSLSYLQQAMLELPKLPVLLQGQLPAPSLLNPNANASYPSKETLLTTIQSWGTFPVETILPRSQGTGLLRVRLHLSPGLHWQTDHHTPMEELSTRGALIHESRPDLPP